MAASNSYEVTSWADQWDEGPDPYPANYDPSKTSTKAKYTKKAGEGLEKTKSVASSGMKKVKTGAHVGFHWIKDKYHKTTGKQ
uniref:uncharacterized protein LOC105351248 n=1 Tax=Fragaria vesca subsp. vesca TaxID=101020 RepID=UPI0005C9B4DA|nr:PREDICTED: uncharacterized protein LOC105351248 [Fragaria vesca subsp. vesca]